MLLIRNPFQILLLCISLFYKQVDKFKVFERFFIFKQKISRKVVNMIMYQFI